MMSAVALSAACGQGFEEADEPGLESTSSAAATTQYTATNACNVIAGPVLKYDDAHNHFVYTLGSNSGAIKCPIPVSSTTTLANFTQILYIDGNGNGLHCQLHSKKNGVDVFSKALVSTKDTDPFNITFGDGTVVHLFHTTDAALLPFSNGAGLDLQCTIGPGALLSYFKVTF